MARPFFNYILSFFLNYKLFVMLGNFLREFFEWVHPMQKKCYVFRNNKCGKIQ